MPTLLHLPIVLHMQPISHTCGEEGQGVGLGGSQGQMWQGSEDGGPCILPEFWLG